MAFQVEVRVRASDKVVQEPVACISRENKECSVYVAGSTFHLNSEAINIHGKHGSTFTRIEAGRWRLVRGTLWIEKAHDLVFETIYGHIMSRSGQFWIIEGEQKITIRNIDAELFVTLADGKKLELPPGFEFWVAGINSKGNNEHGMIQPIVLREHLSQWATLYSGSRRNFLNEAKSLSHRWVDLVEKGAYIYREELDRKVATAAYEDQKRKDASKALELQRQKNKKLYFQRTFER